jgi:formylglycine-generating enzyme required for sulfatase activity
MMNDKFTQSSGKLSPYQSLNLCPSAYDDKFAFFKQYNSVWGKPFFWWDEEGFPRSVKGDFSPPPSGLWRVTRGSSWGNPGTLACRTSMRYGYAPSDRNEHLGFRVLLRSAL